MRLWKNGFARAASCLILSADALALEPAQFSVKSNLKGPVGETIFSISRSGTVTNIHSYPLPGGVAYAATSPLVVTAGGALYGIDISATVLTGLNYDNQQVIINVIGT